MKYVVCFSGGHGSALAAVETVYRYGRDNTILLNHDISSKVEDADVKRFKAEVAEYLGVPIIYANRDNFEKDTPLSLCRQEKMIRFRGGHSICTYYLKTKPFAEWLSENYPVGQGRISDEITLVYGFDAWERRRIDRRRCLPRDITAFILWQIKKACGLRMCGNLGSGSLNPMQLQSMLTA